jgi:hypothetical protein
VDRAIEGHAQGGGELGLPGSWFPGQQQWHTENERDVDGLHEVVGGNVGAGILKPGAIESRDVFRAAGLSRPD